MTVTFSKEERGSIVYRSFFLLNGRKPSRNEYDYWFNESVDKPEEQIIEQMRNNMAMPTLIKKSPLKPAAPAPVNTTLQGSDNKPSSFKAMADSKIASFANSGDKHMQSASVPKLGHLTGGKSFFSATRPTQSTTVDSTKQPTWRSGFRPAPTKGITVDSPALILPTTTVNNNPITGADAIGLNKPPLVKPAKSEKEPAKTKTSHPGLHLGWFKQPEPKPCSSTSSPSCQKKQASYKINTKLNGLFSRKA